MCPHPASPHCPGALPASECPMTSASTITACVTVAIGLPPGELLVPDYFRAPEGAFALFVKNKPIFPGLLESARILFLCSLIKNCGGKVLPKVSDNPPGSLH